MDLKNKTKNYYFLLFTLLLLLTFPSFCKAVILYLEPSSGEFSLGDVFSVSILVDTEKENINVVNVDLNYSSDILTAKDFSQGNSILNLWVEKPEINKGVGKISFTGGIPGGFKGNKGFLGKVFFETKKEGRAEVFFEDSSEILLNDGFGTKADLERKKATFNISAEVLRIPEDQLQKEIEKDNIPPEPFVVEINQSPSIFEGKYFITFNTTDKQTGVDHFEVKEGKRDWKIVSSPYLLENQNLGEEIKVKVVDKAGNERVESIKPRAVKPVIDWRLIVKIVLVILVIIIFYFIYRRLRKRK